MTQSSMMDFFETSGIQPDRDIEQKLRPWMIAHDFVLVQTAAQLNDIVDKAIAAGRCALDLETGGLDNRIYVKKQLEDLLARGLPDQSSNLVKTMLARMVFGEKGMATRHPVVGYCLSYDGQTGYYVPVGHTAEGSVNVPAAEASAAIKRLCLAAQPTLTPKGLAEDGLGSKDIASPGKVKLYFWNAQFDQEFLLPVTGIDYWHPDSFEDGMLLTFCLYTDDLLSLKKKAKEKLSVSMPKCESFAELRAYEAEGEPGVWRVKMHKPGWESRPKVSVPYEMIEMKDLFPRGREVAFATLHPEEAVIYGCSDGICTFKLCEDKAAWKSLAEMASPHPMHLDVYRLEKQVTQVVRRMERNRVAIDRPFVQNLLDEAEHEADQYEKEILAIAAEAGFHNFDIRSAKQLGEFLFGEGGLHIEPAPERNEKSQQFKTDTDTLEALAEQVNQPVLLKVVKFRQIDKIIGTYLENLLEATATCPFGELRVHFKQTGTATARFSAPSGHANCGAGVPVHGIPSTSDDKKPKVATALRHAFIAREGYTYAKVDFAGEELRIGTNLSHEPVWEKEFIHGTGDLHTITARAFYNKQEVSAEERQGGKRANFALAYGGGPAAIVRATGCTKEEGARRKQAFDRAVPGFASWVKNQHNLVKKRLGVRTAFGRWIAIPDANNEDQAIRAACERYSVNYQIQGAGSDIMKIVMVRIHKEFHRRGWLANDDVRMLLTVHDEIVFEIRHALVPEVMKVIVTLMESPTKMARGEDNKPWLVPLIAEPLVGLNWAAKYAYDMILHGKPYKAGEKLKDGWVVQGERAYQKPPAHLVGIIGPPAPSAIPVAPPPGTTAVPGAPPTPRSGVPLPLGGIAPPPPTPQQAGASIRQVATFSIDVLTRKSVKALASFVVRARDKGPDAVILQLTSSRGDVLLDAAQKVTVNLEEFKALLNMSGF